MKVIIRPSKIKGGSVRVPPSKSQSMRALLFASIASGSSRLTNLLSSPDVEAMKQALGLLGASIRQEGSEHIVEGLGGALNGASDVICAGNSGLVYRFIASLAALSEEPVIITGDESIRMRRPIRPLLEALCELGVEAFSTRSEGGAPIFVRGPFKRSKATLEGSDSQPVSGLIIASCFADFPIELTVKNPGERPWVDLTLSWLKRLNIAFERKGYEFYRLEGNARLSSFDYTVPADYSSALFPLALGLITKSPIQLENVDLADPQGDKEAILLLQKLGASLELEKGKIVHHPGAALAGGVIDVNPFIDALPMLATLSLFSKEKTLLCGASIARLKECNRLEALSTELGKMGGSVSEREDGLMIEPTKKLKRADLHCHGDHRIAMALTIAALMAEGESTLTGAECVEKSYPRFFDTLRSLGADVSVVS